VNFVSYVPIIMTNFKSNTKISIGREKKSGINLH
jgi:hypothetical protein